MAIIKKILTVILNWEARLILFKYKPLVVAVTGSVGKTSTKDAIYSVLKHSGSYVRRNEKSLNSELGIPLTIIGAPNAWKNVSGWLSNIRKGLGLILWKNKYPSCLILEVGADHPGEIRAASKMLKPKIAVLLRVSDVPVHVEFFKSPQQVFEEKSVLADGLGISGTLVLFGDDKKMSVVSDRTKARNIPVIDFGLAENSSVRGSDYAVIYDEVGAPSGFSANINFDGNNIPIKVNGILGETYLYPLLAATAVGKAMNMSAGNIAKGLNEYEAPRGRMNIIPGINGSTLIDDSYNSSPDATRSALETLKSLKTNGRKIAVLGDMMELGVHSVGEHRKIGREVVGIVNILVTVGQRSRATAEEALKNGMSADSVHSFDSSREAASFVPNLIGAGDIIRVKGSQSPRTERVSAALLREPNKSAKLLVRQDKEWLERA